MNFDIPAFKLISLENFAKPKEYNSVSEIKRTVAQINCYNISNFTKKEMMAQTTIYYWRQAARIIGIIICLFLVYISINSGLFDAMLGKEGKSIEFFPFAAIAIAGYMISYIKERQGGILMLVGGVSLLAFFIIKSGGTDWLKALEYSIPIIFCGITFVLCNRRE